MGKWQKWHLGTALSMELRGRTLLMWYFKAVRYLLCHCTFIRKLRAAVLCFLTEFREALETLTGFSEGSSMKVTGNMFSVQHHWVIIASPVPASLCFFTVHWHVGTSNGSMAPGWQMGDMMSPKGRTDAWVQVNGLRFWLFLTFTCCLSSQRENLPVSMFTVCLHAVCIKVVHSLPDGCSVSLRLHFCHDRSDTLCLRRGTWTNMLTRGVDSQ